MNSLNLKIRKVYEAKDKERKEIEKQIVEIENVAKSWIGQELSNDASIQDLMQKTAKLSEEIIELQNISHDNSQWIEDLMRKGSDLHPFEELANQELKQSGFGIELRTDSDNQHYGVWHRTDNVKLELKHLSEGERRFLAFIHFYYDLFIKPNETIIQGVDMVIIDDPITSLDSDNRFYLTEFINSFIKFGIKHDIQIFVLTHSSQDFHNFAYNADSKKTKWFKIIKNNTGESEIELLGAEDRKNYSDYYQTTFKDLFMFAQLSAGKLNDSYLSYGNKARMIFESHARSHYKIEYTANKEYRSLKQYYEVPDILDGEVTKMLDVINALSHGLTFIDSVDISPKELQLNVRTLLRILYHKDKQHVLQMAGNIINKSNRNDTERWLKDWNVM